MFQDKYLSSSSSGFLQEFLGGFNKKFYHTHIGENNNPHPGCGSFWPQGVYLNKLGRHSLEDISCLES
jgi:hypothetical protein